MAIGTRDENHFVFGGEARHHLNHARIHGAGFFLQPLQQRDLVGVRKAHQRIDRVIQQATVAAARHGGLPLLPGARNGAGGVGGGTECVKTDVVGIGERGFSPEIARTPTP